MRSITDVLTISNKDNTVQCCIMHHYGDGTGLDITCALRAPRALYTTQFKLCGIGGILTEYWIFRVFSESLPTSYYVTR